MTGRLRELINFQSYSEKEKPILKHIKTQLEKDGIQPFFQKDNLIVKLVGEDQTQAFIFNGHVDVVDIGDISKWQHNPWAGEIGNGRIYGRGTTDMKGGVLAMMEAAKSLVRRRVLPTDVWFTFVVREETDGQGTKQFAKWFQSEGYTKQYRESAAIFAEPTSLQTAKHGHRGNFFLKAIAEGTPTHSSRPHAIEKHAILNTVEFIQDLQKESMLWEKQFKSSEFTSPTITPTSISALSGSPNKTPDKCETVFDLRTIPGFHEEALERVKGLARKRGITVTFLYPPAPAGYTKPDAKIVQAVQKIVPEIQLTVNEASNDLGFLTEIGIEGVSFGPGDNNVAHTVDEYAEIDQVLTAPKLFEQIYDSWAKISSNV